jgi:hypothetical protein
MDNLHFHQSYLTMGDLNVQNPQPKTRCLWNVKTTQRVFFFSGEGPRSRRYGRTCATLGEKSVSVPLCPPQIPHGLTRNRTRASAVRGRRLTAWAMARPFKGSRSTHGIKHFESLRSWFLKVKTQNFTQILFLKVCHFTGLQRSQNPFNTNKQMSTAQKRQRPVRATFTTLTLNKSAQWYVAAQSFITFG